MQCKCREEKHIGRCPYCGAGGTALSAFNSLFGGEPLTHDCPTMEDVYGELAKVKQVFEHIYWRVRDKEEEEEGEEDE